MGITTAVIPTAAAKQTTYFQNEWDPKQKIPVNIQSSKGCVRVATSYLSPSWNWQMVAQLKKSEEKKPRQSLLGK